MRRRDTNLFWTILITAVLAVLVLCAYAACKRSLHTLCIQSGWLAAILIAAVALSWWKLDINRQRLVRRVRLQVCLSSLLVVMLAVHLDLRVPNGWMDLALTVLFIAMIASTIAGTVIVRTAACDRDVLRQRSDPPKPDWADLVAVRRWLFVHVPLNLSLLSLAVIHGVYEHGHGMFAFFFIER